MSEADAKLLSAAVSAEIRAEMAKRRLSSRQVAEMTGLKQTTLSLHLRDAGAFGLDEVATICSALGVDVAELITRASKA